MRQAISRKTNSLAIKFHLYYVNHLSSLFWPRFTKRTLWEMSRSMKILTLQVTQCKWLHHPAGSTNQRLVLIHSFPHPFLCGSLPVRPWKSFPFLLSQVPALNIEAPRRRALSDSLQISSPRSTTVSSLGASVPQTHSKPGPSSMGAGLLTTAKRHRHTHPV